MPRNLNKMINPQIITNELITKRELARKLRLCNRKIELMVNAGEIPVVRIGRSVRFEYNEVVAAIKADESNN